MFISTSSVAMLMNSGAAHPPATLADEVARNWRQFQDDFTPSDFHKFCCEVFFCRTIDALQRYIESMLIAVFTQRPETLKSSEQIKVSEALSCATMDELIQRIAEKRVSTLSYKGFDDLISYMTRDMGLPLDKDSAEVRFAREGIEIRNLIVHSACRVNSVFLRRTQRSDLKEGDSLSLDYPYVLESGKHTESLVESLDCAFVTHFNLYRVRPRTEQ